MNELAEIWEIYIFKFVNEIFELYEDLKADVHLATWFHSHLNYCPSCFQTVNVLCYNLSSRFNMHVVFSKFKKKLQIFTIKFLFSTETFFVFLASADPVSTSVSVYPCFWRCDAWSFSVCAGQREQSCSRCDRVTRMKLNVWTCEDNKWSRLPAWKLHSSMCLRSVSQISRPARMLEGRLNRTTTVENWGSKIISVFLPIQMKWNLLNMLSVTFSQFYFQSFS